ncbi:MAG: hypothetical protein Q7S02_00900, partial [bacterium]|nr:hypothetical protein [bacterium]
MRGTGFACRSTITKAVVTWVHDGASQSADLRATDGDPFQLTGDPHTTFDGAVAFTLTPYPNAFIARNHLDATHVDVTFTDATGRKTEATRLDLLRKHEAILDRDWARTERGGSETLMPGDWVRLRLRGFTVGRRVAMQMVDEGLLPEPLASTNAAAAAWDRALRNRFTNVRSTFVDQNPGSVDFKLPDDVPIGTHRFIILDVTDMAELVRLRPRAEVRLTIGNNAKPIPEPTPGPAPIVVPTPAPKTAVGVTVQPSTAAQGSTVTIRIKGFDPNSVPTVTVGTERVSRFTSYTDSHGALTLSYTIPAAMKNGAVMVTATDANGHRATATLAIEGKRVAPTVSVAPASGPPGLAVTLRGAGWDTSEKSLALIAEGSARERALTINADSCAKTIGAPTCDGGEILMSVRLPDDVAVGTYRIEVRSAIARAATAFRVVQPDVPPGRSAAIGIAPKNGPVGTTVTVTGARFAPKAGVLFTLNGVAVTIIRGARTTDAAGGLAGTVITIPDTKLGTSTIIVTDGRGGRASATFEVIGVSPTPAPPPKDQPCNPDLPSFYEDACSKKSPDPVRVTPLPVPPSPPPKPTPTPIPPEPPEPKYCNLDLPKIWQEGCVPRPELEQPKEIPNCDPNIPKYAQPGCREAVLPNEERIAAPSKRSLLERLLEPIVIALFMPTEIVAAPAPPKTMPARKSLVGTYRCWSYNVSGGGGSCRLAPPIVLTKDGTYTESSTRGKFTLRGNRITLSKSTLRGPGTISDDGMRIRFEYTYRGWRHTVTYLKQPVAGVPTSPPGGSAIALDLTIEFPGDDYVTDTANVAQLVPSGKEEPVYEAIAYAPDRSHMKAYYKSGRRASDIMSGMVYDVFLTTGRERIAIGTLDL